MTTHKLVPTSKKVPRENDAVKRKNSILPSTATPNSAHALPQQKKPHVKNGPYVSTSSFSRSAPPLFVRLRCSSSM